MGIHSLKPDPDRSLGARSARAPADTDAARTTDLPNPRIRRTATDRTGSDRVPTPARGSSRPDPTPARGGNRAPLRGGGPTDPAPARGGGPARRARHAKPPARTARTNRRTPTPFHQNKRLLFGAVIVAALAVSVVSYVVWRGAGPGRPCGPEYLGKQGSDICADDRGTVAMENLTVSATPLAATDNGSGGLTLCSDVTLSNNSDAKQDYNIQDFRIQNPAGQQDAPDPSVISGTLRSGSLGLDGTKTGRICDDGRAQKGLYALIYSPSLFDSRRGVWLSQH